MQDLSKLPVSVKECIESFNSMVMFHLGLMSDIYYYQEHRGKTIPLECAAFGGWIIVGILWERFHCLPSRHTRRQESTCAMHFLHRDANTFSASRGSVSFDGDKMRTVSCTSAQHTMYFMELRGMTKANSQFEWEVYETCRRASKREREQILSGAHGKFVNECCSAFLPSYMYIERCRPMVPFCHDVCAFYFQYRGF